ncbi:MAG: dTDP-glucose 4,6-dehydratase [Zetaproteobacteria bacterium CG_4_9_14_3_um_filter_49_83]|nr:MAG: dTDP-glucose 4,6-dehydratase [Zetaproteobacteria bacterium CG1_02_49_23]PIQ32418.1 MAG: dTDP-glucose 4,6-dehydratase [Zetaproteobacteria bacterium CG17_big_fil_post_rev_8_21_14_2_50_50_13]PIV30859.1 MAG: dTDP-glucose 4,6-dehydratase [Zetaproteobacteria bacterium CG02_land_8_20_14_3_00_50_9]PIY56251.1 MAG: dTDP-glucose 4,6-dehydratase [Zetaproteobacteria bacterium CG_4_10_14_0_8_um_filter_49_80]PJA34734.1 MAG: dTDP-glucose 4,6-dehydratase [Zetaproteobacteria bacterium CG_4_9_14_3_um_filt
MSEYKPKNILVTGGAGFIGCNYVRYMLETDKSVNIINLDAITYAGSLDNLKDLPGESRHTFVQGDICDRELIDKLMRQHEIDTIVHFAAESHVDNSISGPEIFVKTNVMGTFTLLDVARKYWQGEKNWGKENCRFHHISTDEVYGTLEATDPAFSETTPYAPNSPYSASKAGSDHLVRAYFHTYGLPVTTTNCSNNYGSYQHGEKFIPTVIRKCLEQESIPVYGDGTNIRDWLYVTDHCSGIDAVVRKGELGEVYNIGGINEWKNIDICRLICQLMDEHKPENAPHEKLITFVKDRPGHDWRYAIDATKMNDKLNWQPAETFETGIRKTVAWYLENQSNRLSHI